MNTFTCI